MFGMKYTYGKIIMMKYLISLCAYYSACVLLKSIYNSVCNCDLWPSLQLALHILFTYSVHVHIDGHILLHADRFATKMAKTVPFIEPGLTMA